METSLTDSQKLLNGLCGLKNTCNDCYMNAVLVALVDNVDLSNYILNSLSDDLFITSYRKFLKVCWQENKPISPVSLKKIIKEKFPKYNENNKMDAQEFLLDFLELLHNSLKTISTESNNIILNDHGLSSSKQWNEYFENKFSIISELFTGQTIKRGNCSTCFTKNFFNYDLFSNMIIYPKMGGNVSVSKLIEDTFQKDFSPYRCSECDPDSEETDKEHEITSFVYKLPETLIVTINRFNGDSTKNTGSCTIDTELNLSNYYYSNGIESAKYELKSVILHLGGNTLNDGHYVTIIKRKENLYLIDDHQVSLLTKPLNEINGSFPYLLFYSKI